MEQLEYEKEHLKNTLIKYDEFIEDTKLEYKNVYKLSTNQDEALIRKKYLENKINTLTINSDKPYFARIDFINDESVKDICYIGKVGVYNYDNEVIVVDWRAPISSLYYDSTLGKTSYKSNNDIINGKLELKRQYNIENRKLIDFFDVDTVSNDELLKPYLDVNADSRTKNIVATIQKEQNEIIRSSISKNIIIQGVAGSGKTTVALHRIAYLAYNYRDVIKNDQYMVIGPNKFFINYISDMLPELDVHDVAEYDLIELAQDFIGEKILIQDEEKTLREYLNGNKNTLPKIKTSMEFKTIIDNYFNEYFKNLNINSIKINEFTVIPSTVIESTWKEILKRNYDDLKSAVDRLLILLNKYYEENKESIISKFNTHINKKLDNNKNLDKCRKERKNTLDKLNSNMTSIIKNHFKNIFKSSLIIYKDLKSNISKYTNNEIIIKGLDNNIKYEDLPILMYIEYKMNCNKTYEKYKHIVVDEAQDYNDFTFYVFKKIFSKSSFSIYGDIAQSIYSYRSLDDWNSVKTNVFKEVEIKYLEKSYRTTIEIMNEANKINKLLKLPEAKAVIRHGAPVKYLKLGSFEIIKTSIEELLKNGKKNIAIISKDTEKSTQLFSYLKNFFEITNITNKNQNYNSGLCTISGHLSKGLEFDAVIINNMSDFDLNNILDMKILYVAMTRALHSLIITYKDEEILKIFK